jgi:UDP-3-O-[3-hydroxymyristoyl] glucosamine N-acyltransferase
MAAAAAHSGAALILVPGADSVADPRALPVKDVWGAVLTLLNHFHPPPAVEPFRHPSAIVHESATIGANVHIGPYVVIEENASVGDGTRVGAFTFIGAEASVGRGATLLERVTLREGCRLGDRVLVHSGVVIGSDGFKYETIGGRLTKMPQVGIVVVEDDVEIGANSAIDRASFSLTRFGARTKIDNFVHIAHNCDIGPDCILVAQVGIAGSAKLGRGVLIAGQSGVADHAVVGDGVRVGGQSGVRGRIAPGLELVGSPAIEAKQFARLQVMLRRFPDIYAQLRPLLKSTGETGGEEDAGPLPGQ